MLSPQSIVWEAQKQGDQSSPDNSMASSPASSRHGRVTGGLGFYRENALRNAVPLR